jgi:hypothetical protein
MVQLTVLHGIAAMVQIYNHLQIVPAGTAESTMLASRESALPDESQYRWLLRVFDSLHQTFRLSESSAETPLAILLVFELVLLHFHCPVDQMELLAGREGFEEAHSSYPVLQRWVESREARRALWQAGQILKLVRALPLETMSDFHCVALYHAGLCLWTYGTITSRRCGALPSEVYFSEAPDIMLDGQESMETQRWVAFDRGRPVISNPVYGSEADVPPGISVQSTDVVMQTCIHTIRGKYPSRIVLPPSTESFCYLLHALGMTARKDPKSV